MSRPLQKLQRFFRELKRRNVYKVAVGYLVAAFVALQAADLLVPETTLPAGTETVIVYLTIAGFPIALVIAWAFEMTPEGVRRTAELDPVEEEPFGSGEEGLSTGYKLLGGLGLAAAALAGGWYLTGGGGEKAAAADPPRVVVLPFESIARDSNNAFFARGMHAEVTSALSKISGLAVLSRKTSLELARTDMTIAEIGSTQDADAVLEGSVLRSGDRLRVNTRLVDARRDEQLWSTTYTRRTEVGEIIEIQADLAEKVSRELQTRLTDAEEARISRIPTPDVSAYDAFLKGRDQYERRYWEELTFESIDRATRWLREAIRRDSGFAEAHAYLAEVYRQRTYYSTSEERWLDSTRLALRRARAIDPDVPVIHWVEGFLHLSRDSLGPAGEAFQRALDLEPSNAVACSGLASLRAVQGRLAEAIRWAHRAYRLEPTRPFRLNEMGGLLASVGMLEEAEAWQRRALEMNPDHLVSVIGLSMTQAQRNPAVGLETVASYLDRQPGNREALRVAARLAYAAGRPEQAKAYLDRMAGAEATPTPGQAPGGAGRTKYRWRDRMVLGLTELRLGNQERGRQLVENASAAARGGVADEKLASRWGRSVWLAGGLAARGEEAQALEILERSLELSTPVGANLFDLASLRLNPAFRSLRSSGRFEDIIQEVEARRAKIREEVGQLDIELRPSMGRREASTR